MLQKNSNQDHEMKRIVDDSDGENDDESVSASIEWAAWGASCILPTQPTHSP